MTILQYANNATSSLQSGISATSLTCVLATGQGALFPQPAAGLTFYMTFLDAATKLVNEVVLVTARSGDALTIVRAQQGSTALPWAAGDIATQLWTRGDPPNFVQNDQLQVGTLLRVQGAGSVNSITATLPSGMTTLPDLFACTINSTGANTGSTTLTLTLGTLIQPAYAILKLGGSQLNAGDIPIAGYPISLIFSFTLNGFIMQNPGTSSSGSIAGGAENELLLQTAAGTTGFISPPTVAGQVLAFVGGVIQWAAAAVTSFKGRSGAVVPQSGDYTAAQVGAIPTTAFAAPNVQYGNPMFAALPYSTAAVFIQAGSQSVVPNNPTPITFPHAFPNACIAVLVSGNNASSALNVVNGGTGFFTVTVNANFVNWIAAGY